MSYLYYYLSFYIISIILINGLSLIKQKNNELPIAITLFGIIFGFVQANNKILYFLVVVLTLIFLPFVNIFVFIQNFDSGKTILESKSKYDFEYNFDLSIETIEFFKNTLNQNIIKYKEKYIKENLKSIFIFSLRSYLTFLTKNNKSKDENIYFNLNDLNFKYILMLKFELNKLDFTDQFLESLNLDLINYVKQNKEQLDSKDIFVDDNGLYIKNNFKVYKQPKELKIENIDLDDL